MKILLDGYLLLLSTFTGPVASMVLSMKYLKDPNLVNNPHKIAYIFIGILVAYILFTIYCLPVKIAAYRNHPQENKIRWINYLLAPTVIMWFVALGWSLSGKKADS